jgi:hypothetical protein
VKKLSKRLEKGGIPEKSPGIKYCFYAAVVRSRAGCPIQQQVARIGKRVARLAKSSSQRP